MKQRIGAICLILAASDASAGVIATSECRRWPPMSPVEYFIDPSYDARTQAAIAAAATVWNIDSPVKLHRVNTRPAPGAYIWFYPEADPNVGVLGSSTICRQEEAYHPVFIRPLGRHKAPDGSFVDVTTRVLLDTLLHELGHAFGLLHEFQHCRSQPYFAISLRDSTAKQFDAGDYTRFNCFALSNQWGALSVGEWDPVSVMNYDVSLAPIGAYEFTKKGLDLLDLNGVKPGNLGQPGRLSRGDVEALKSALGL